MLLLDRLDSLDMTNLGHEFVSLTFCFDSVDLTGDRGRWRLATKHDPSQDPADRHENEPSISEECPHGLVESERRFRMAEQT